jgi:hypothetical protein
VKITDRKVRITGAGSGIEDRSLQVTPEHEVVIR